MISNIEKLKRKFGFDFLSFNHNKITSMIEVKAGKFNEKGASKGIWIDVDDWLLLPGIHKISEIDKLTGNKKIIGNVEMNEKQAKNNLKNVMTILKRQYENVLEGKGFEELELNGLVQHKGFEYEVKYG